MYVPTLGALQETVVPFSRPFLGGMAQAKDGDSPVLSTAHTAIVLLPSTAAVAEHFLPAQPTIETLQRRIFPYNADPGIRQYPTLERSAHENGFRLPSAHASLSSPNVHSPVAQAIAPARCRGFCWFRARPVQTCVRAHQDR